MTSLLPRSSHPEKEPRDPTVQRSPAWLGRVLRSREMQAACPLQAEHDISRTGGLGTRVGRARREGTEGTPPELMEPRGRDFQIALEHPGISDLHDHICPIRTQCHLTGGGDAEGICHSACMWPAPVPSNGHSSPWKKELDSKT